MLRQALQDDASFRGVDEDDTPPGFMHAFFEDDPTNVESAASGTEDSNRIAYTLTMYELRVWRENGRWQNLKIPIAEKIRQVLQSTA